MNDGQLEGYELSTQQRTAWLAADRPLLWTHCLVELKGELDREKLFDAFNGLVDRFSILRTTFQALPGMSVPLQQVLQPGFGFRPLEADLGKTAASPLIADFGLFADYRSDRDSPLWVRLQPRSAHSHLLQIGLPALCGDARTLSLLLQDLGRLYGGETDAAAEPLPYIQFAHWQKEVRESEEAQVGELLWDEACRLPAFLAATAGRRPWNLCEEKAKKSLHCSSAPLAEISIPNLAKTEDLRLLGVWKCLIWKLTAADDLVTGVELSGRGHPLLDDARGPFAQHFPISARITPDLRLPELLEQLEASLEKAAERPYGLPPPETAQTGFPFAYSYHEWPSRLSFGDLDARVTAAYSRLCASAVHLNAVRQGRRLILQLIVDENRIGSGAAERLRIWMETLLNRLAENPDAPLADLALTGADEEHRVLVEFNSERVDFPTDRCIHDLFEEQARRTPNRPAVVDQRQELTYKQLDSRAAMLAHELARRGVGPERTAGILLERSVSQLTALLAILKAGGAALPLDPTFPAKRLEWMLQEARPSVILTSRNLKGLLPQSFPALLDDDWEGLGASQGLSSEALKRATPENLCYVLYTSGSTGKPRGVMIEHRSAANLRAVLKQAVYPGVSRLRVGMNAPLTFDASVKQWMQLLDGHTLYLFPEAVRYDPRLLSDFLARRRLDALDCTPSQLRPLLDIEQSHRPQFVLIGGEEIDAALWSRLRESGRAENFFNVYGPTECTVDSTMAGLDLWEEPTIGRPLPNSKIYILDGCLNPVPPGVPGEIFIGGPGVGRGYLAQPELSAERFLPDPFSGEPGRRMYRSGDLACWGASGEILFMGRFDHQIKLRGFRIELGEIEALLRSHPAVLDAAVLVRGKPPDEPFLAAFAAAGRRAKDPALLEDVRSWLREHLPEYMVPTRIVLQESLPVSSRGKTDRQALADCPLPDPPAVRFVPPDNDAERRIADIWRRVLERERVGVEDNFFDLGGHSLLMAQAYSQLQEAFGGNFSMIDLFRCPTVRSLAQFLEKGSPQGPSFGAVQQRAQRQRRAFGARTERGSPAKRAESEGPHE